MRRQQVNREDRGATAITIAISMLLLMGFTAITIDGGLAYGDRRVLASAADTGALAALQFARPSLISGPPCTTAVPLKEQAACRGAEEAIEVVNGTLPSGTLPSRFDAAAWAACTDPNRPAEFDVNVSPLSPCISFTENFSKSRVKMPDTDLPTTFGRLIGFNSILTGANAEAGIHMSSTSNVKPWAQGPAGAGADQVCLMANSNQPPQLDIKPCNGPAEGNFGKLDIALYGHPDLGTPQICGPAMSTLKMATNIIVGADHFLVEANGNPVVNDFDHCGSILPVHVNEVRTGPGNASVGIYQGFFGGIAAPDLEGLLMCKNGSAGEDSSRDPVLNSSNCEPVHDFFPENLDDTPLWTFINPSNELNGGLCPSPLLPGAIDNRQDMEICLNAWPAVPTTYLFGEAIATSPRFGAVPILVDDPTQGAADYLIKEFRPIYISTLYLNCTGPTCETVHSPGELSIVPCPPPPTPLIDTDNSCGWPAVGPQPRVTAVTSFMLTVDMLHPDLADNFPGAGSALSFNLSK